MSRLSERKFQTRPCARDHHATIAETGVEFARVYFVVQPPPPPTTFRLSYGERGNKNRRASTELKRNNRKRKRRSSFDSYRKTIATGDIEELDIQNVIPSCKAPTYIYICSQITRRTSVVFGCPKYSGNREQTVNAFKPLLIRVYDT